MDGGSVSVQCRRKKRPEPQGYSTIPTPAKLNARDKIIGLDPGWPWLFVGKARRGRMVLDKSLVFQVSNKTYYDKARMTAATLPNSAKVARLMSQTQSVRRQASAILCIFRCYESLPTLSHKVETTRKSFPKGQRFCG